MSDDTSKKLRIVYALQSKMNPDQISGFYRTPPAEKMSYKSVAFVEKTAYEELKQQALLMREAVVEQTEEHSDESYFLRKALEQFDEFMKESK